MRFKSFRLNHTGEKSDKEKTPEESIKLPDVAGIEKKINSKTKELKDAENQIKGLSDAARKIEEEEEEIPGPHGPLIELTVDPGDELVDLDTEAELNNLMDADEDNKNDEEQDIKVVEVGKKNTAGATGKAKKKGQNEKSQSEKSQSEKSDEIKPENAPKNSTDDFNNLFSQQEEEVNPLANLISSLPEVSAQELINELEEIKEIIRERQQNG